MKKEFLLLFISIAWLQVLQAQLYISPGAEIKMTANAMLTLNNTDLVNNGTFNQTEGTVHFSGINNNTIGGTSVIRFYNLNMAKAINTNVSLLRTISVDNEINFAGGNIDLNGSNILLSATGMMVGENLNSRVTGTAGGYVQISSTLNNPSAANPGNLGAIITSSANMGTTAIRRGHQSQVNGSGTGNSILRYFDILPSNNNALNATLRFHYFDTEINSLNESTIVFWKSINNSTWTNEGFTSRSTTTNYVEKTAIPSFSRWTLSSTNNALPVLFTLFNGRCEGNNIFINWKTAQEVNSSYFDVEKSDNGNSWTVISRVTAAGNSSTERSYTVTDNNSNSQNLYRIAQYDMNGSVRYTGIIKVTCNDNELFKVWPNPFTEIVFVNISSTRAATVSIKIYDSKGALVKIQQGSLLRGNNQLPVIVKNLPAGMYQLVAEWNNRETIKTISIIKQ